MKSALAAAAWLPGLPHLLRSEKSPAWAKLGEACGKLGELGRAQSPDVIILYSTQWLSVLGTSFQARERLRGVHVDENWYELGDLSYEFRTRPELAGLFARTVREKGFSTRTVDYEGFPIDTGTIVALRYLNPDGKIPVCNVSSWVYASAEASRSIGSAMREACQSAGVRAWFVASSGLSSRFFTSDIDPRMDHLSSESDDKWNQKVLGLWESGDLAGVTSLSSEYAREARVDMQFNAFHWLSGVLQETPVTGRVLGYGPLWGTGGAVVDFTSAGGAR